MANIGIDLGTTNSLVAAVLSGKARVLLDENERSILPSAAVLQSDGSVVALGDDALGRTLEPNEHLFTSTKRFMGQAPAQVAEEAQRLGYELAEDSGVVRFQLSPEHRITPVEIAALLLKQLNTIAEECLFSAPTGAVITVPAYFDDAQRQATKDAAKIAGIEVLRLINEPTAAALAYGLQTGTSGRKVAVYDLGGGTFDVSILELDDGVFQVKSTAGDTQLGGDDFDHALSSVILQQFGLSDVDSKTYRQVLNAARQAKHALTASESADIRLNIQGQAAEINIDRATAHAIWSPILNRTQAACTQALQDAGLSLSDIDDVVLVGGSTRMPLVRAFAKEFFQKEPHVDLNPDEVVAIGAAIQADILTGTSELADDILLLDVLPLSLGIEIMGGIVERIIPRCTPIPASASQRFTTHVDAQQSMKLHVLQGERELVGDNRSLAQFSLDGLPNLPAGVPRINVVFTVDANGILQVEATEEFTGTQAAITVTPAHGLDEDEIEEMLEAAIDNAESDVEKRLLIEAATEAEQVLYALQGALAVDSALIQSEEERAAIEQVSTDLKSAMLNGDRQRIAQLTRRLDEVSAPFAQRRIERDLVLAVQGRTADDVAVHLGVSPE